MKDFLRSTQFRLLALVLLVLLPFLCKAIVDYRSQSEQAIESARASVLHVSNMVVQEQRALFDQADQLLYVLSLTPEVRQGDVGTCNELISSVRHRFPRYANIGVVDLDGRDLCGAFGDDDGINVANVYWFQRATDANETVVGDYAVLPETGRTVFTSARPVYGPAGDMTGVLFADIDLGWLCDYIENMLFPAGVCVAFVDHTGRVLASYPKVDGLWGQPLTDELALRFGQQESGTFVASDARGQKTVFGYTRLCCMPQRNVYVVSGIDCDLALADAQSTLMASAAIFAAIALIGMLLSGVIADRVVIGPIRAIVAVINRFNVGDYQARVGVNSKAGEMCLIGNALNSMAQAIQMREEEHVRIENDLRREKAWRKTLLEKTISAQEEERKRIARDLHDSTCQNLAALTINLDACALSLPAANDAGTEEADDAARYLRTSKELATAALDDLHRTINDLHPSLLDNLGLACAMQWYGEQHLAPAGVAFEFSGTNLQVRLSPPVETALFRIVQEALNNVARHARAHRVAVTMNANDDLLAISIVDDGCGFDPGDTMDSQDSWRGLGLRGMQERAAIIGGSLRIDSTEEGTSVLIEVPLAEADVRSEAKGDTGDTAGA